MRNAQYTQDKSETPVRPKRFGMTRRRPAFGGMIVFLILAVTLFDSGHAFAITGELVTAPRLSSPNYFSLVQDYSKFSHSFPKQHADLTASSNCAGCHRRGDGSVGLKFPAHKNCMGCHLIQFTRSTSSDNPICLICHVKGGVDASNLPTKSFPRVRNFTAEFDHAQHLRGFDSARPAEGCAACHAPALRGAAISIPTRLGAHQTCFKCHSPGKQAGDFSSCGSCHKPGAFSPTPVASRSYRVGFRHSDHGPRQRLACESCHNVLGRGLPQRKQVSSISPFLHRSSVRARSCMTCHNGQRAFGDERAEFHNCKRCHKGRSFRS